MMSSGAWQAPLGPSWAKCDAARAGLHGAVTVIGLRYGAPSGQRRKNDLRRWVSEARGAGRSNWQALQSRRRCFCHSRTAAKLHVERAPPPAAQPTPPS